MCKKIFLLFLTISHWLFPVTGNKVWRVPNSGSLPSWGPINLADSANAITGQLPFANLPTLNFILGTFVTTIGTSSTTYVDLAGLSVSITTHGRPVIFGLLADLGDSASSAVFVYSTSNTTGASLHFVRGSTGIGQISFGNLNVTNAAADVFSYIPISSVFTIDTPSAGTYTYKLQGRVNFSSNQLSIGATPYAYELQF